MAKLSDPPPRGMPEDIAKAAEALVRAGRFGSVEEVLRAGVEMVAATADADADAWQDYQARAPQDPRDLNAAEALACLRSNDPEKQRVLTAHLDALRADVLNGRGDERPVGEMMAKIRADLGLPPRL
jgi:Arc/MetJ-type ribon-helix-helix transcriptional regulator